VEETMKKALMGAAAAGLLAFAYAQPSAAAQAAAATPPPAAPAARPAAPAATGPLEILQVHDNVWAIFGAGGNITVSVGQDGVFMVDTGLAQNADRVLDAVRRIQAIQQLRLPQAGQDFGAETRSTVERQLGGNQPPKPIRFIINTHAHADHVGGNGKIKAAGRTFTGGNVANDIGDAAEGAMLIAHENAQNSMVMPPGGGAPAAEDDLPSTTFYGSAMKFSHFFNGESITYYHPANAHTDGDTYVYFRGSDVIATGDIFVENQYPFIDIARGGSINGLIKAVNDIIALAVPEYRTEGGTMVVPGHGRVSDLADLAYYRDMLSIIRDRVQEMIDKKMTLEQVKAARPTRDYDPRWGATSGFNTTDNFVEAVYKTLQPPPRATRARR
jgi:glyoxylase-like metal-dependent hydrolase (beta-lactamase superfamily II)